MIRSFGKFLYRNKSYTAINTFGFAVSLMFVILIGLYIQDELRVDRQHLKGDRIYRLEHAKGITFGSPTASGLEVRYPEIEATARICFYPGGQLYSPVMGQLYLGNVWHADSTVFDIFSFAFVEGDPHTALRSKENVVLSETFARKMFGDQPAVGQRVKVYEKSKSEFIVSGVIRDFDRTHFKPVDIIYPMSKMQAEDRAFGMNFNDFQTRSYATYILTKPGVDLRSKTVGMPAAFRELGDPLFINDPNQSISLVPLTDIYFHRAIDDTGWFQTNSSVFVIILGITALLILAFAMINYINLSVAQTEFRAKAAAIRRLLGETKERLFAGFIAESVAMCVVSLLIGLVLVKLTEPYFQQIMHTRVGLASGMTWGNGVVIIVGILVVGVISGIIPALAISRYRPIEVVRGTLARKSKMTFGKALIVFQYVVAVVLIGCTITISRQVRYMQTQDLGFESDCILGMNNIVGKDNQAGFKNQLMAISGVEQVSFTRGYPTEGGQTMEWMLDNGEQIQMQEFLGDTAFMSMMRFEVLYRTGVDDQDAVWLNETAWRKLDLVADAKELPVNSQLKLKLKGRIRDFHFQDYTQSVGMVMVGLLPAYERGWQLLVKVSKADPYGTREKIRQLYNTKAGGEVFDGVFLNEQINAQYGRQRQMVGIIGTLSIVAIVISALGMLAMATYYTRQREREVAVRKVFGSTSREILLRVVGAFVKMVAIAFVIAIPVMLYLMREWLAGYAYRIDLSWTIFALAGAVALFIAGSSVLWQSIRTANTNPVDVLRK